ncbi:hypothetical protein DL765_005697 [Monosporascus sp. GIB2]|nr:hypothetical protein DL765_005697 [Monosporascus sp. GIB2]
MLLLHQVGSVKIGEVVRYTVTYTPSRDRILPSPEYLYLRIRNTSPVPLRAAFVHGPYTLCVSAYPSHFDPNTKFENPRRYGVPEHEPMLKAGGTWLCKLTVPDDIRQSAGAGASRGDFADAGAAGGGERNKESASWIVEVVSQVIFSASAAVGYEVMLARDEKSLSLSSVPVIGNQAQVPQPGRVADFQQSIGAEDGHHPAQPKGVFSRAITLKVEDTASLWNTPQLPGWREWDHGRTKSEGEEAAVRSVTEPPQDPRGDSETRKRPKKVHLVVLTHGLHSNLGADMLYMKESIDKTVRQAKIDARARRTREARQEHAQAEHKQQSGESNEAEQDKAVSREEEEEYDDEEVIVRGFSGNATRTERGIKFLGKRLARFVLSMTYPDQPYLPTSKKAAGGIASAFRGEESKGEPNTPAAHKNSTTHKAKHHQDSRAFQITSISFIGHSLGGLVQTYAIAYIQKHSPQFFDLIRPINFIALASPMLGLSNENPLYVKFALDFGLVGRTGQDLGLTWRAPTIARSGWGAIVGTLGETAHKKVMGEPQPESKPLLRILPTGPAHVALKKFRNRTLYSNVVNDGIVPLRTSCLLFLDWQGLGRVEKARREAGLVETLAGFGWAELTGANASSKKEQWVPEAEGTSSTQSTTSSAQEAEEHADSLEVPQPPSNATVEDDRKSLSLARTPYKNEPSQNSQTNNDFPFSGFFNFFKSSSSESKAQAQKVSSSSPRESRIYQRSQTIKFDGATTTSASSSTSRVTTGRESGGDHENGVSAPPRTTFFEAAGDLLNPNYPSVEFLIDPSRRPRTIFHDRVYHPSDIPPPPLKKRPTGSLLRKSSRGDGPPPPPEGGAKSSSSPPSQSRAPSNVGRQDSSLSARDYYDDRGGQGGDDNSGVMVDSSSMKVEEKIARAYHRDLSWRKVLVKLEPDAHNNIIVRRTFANAYGWPVVKHLCDAHFSDAAAARTHDELETGAERAKPVKESPDNTGAETSTQDDTAARGKGSGEPAGAGSGSGGVNCNGNGGCGDFPQAPGPEKRSPVHNNVASSHGHTAGEALEARDTVPELRSSSSAVQEKGGFASHSAAGHHPHHNSQQQQQNLHIQPPSPSSRPNGLGIDSSVDWGSWSDRDFADSGDESEVDYDVMIYGGQLVNNTRDKGNKGKGKGKDKNKEEAGEQLGRASSPGWNWTEKIVGKGRKGSRGGGGPPSPKASRGPLSPRSPRQNPLSPQQQDPQSPLELQRSRSP